MDEIFEDLNEIEHLGEVDFGDPPASPEVPRMHNVFLRDVRDPFTYYTNQEFKSRYRFTKATVRDVIVPLINENIDQGSMRGLKIPKEMKVLVALRFFATGSFQIVCGDLHYISQPTVSRIIKTVSVALASKVEEFVKFPAELISTKKKFRLVQQRYQGLRNIVGAIDCTHIKINRPRRLENTEVYRNRKGYFSINTQAVVGPDMKIYNIVARWPGSSHDSRIFRNSRICAELEARQLQGVLVGDSGYRATTYMLTPFVNPITPAQIRYNYVQVRTRTVVERCFGVWKKIFPCLQVGLKTKLQTATNIIVACAVLFNIKIVNEGLEEEEELEEVEAAEPAVNDVNNQNTASGIAYRNSIVDQFYNY